jgi:hypothetical protein
VVGGVGGRLRQALQLQHDLGVAEIWARRGQDAGPRWLSEDAYRAHCQLERKSKVPDAVILDTRAPDKHGALLRVIEFGGRYSRQRLENFHRFWSRRGVDYEIW